mgnify:CR=1 FL=1
MSLLDQAEFASPDQLRAHQAAAWAVQGDYVARNSTFYKDLWQGAAPPADLADLPALPLSDKAQLRVAQADHPPFGHYMAAPRADAVRLHRTSGTTGQAMNLALSARDCAVTEAVGGRCQSSAGLTPDHTVVHCLNYQMWMGGLTDHMTLQATGALVVPFGVGATDLLVRTIREVGITAISCTPSYPAVLERVIAERFPDLTPRDLGLQLGLFGGEAGLDDPAFRARLKEVWGMEPRNANYGVSDVFCNFAAQCEHDTRLHFMAADVLWPELIDPETGAVSIIRYAAVEDVGAVLNPVLVEGQLQGGIAQGLSLGLGERMVFDDAGQILTGSLMDYHMARAADLPSFELANVEVPTALNPLGVKGVGEAGAVGATAALISAVGDALHRAGVDEFEMPATPSRIWQALVRAGRRD